jgi:pimeloyl-ACP methyl ester carboxylesterase
VASLVLIGPPGVQQPKPGAAAPAAVGVWQQWTAESGLKRIQAGAPEAEAARIFPATWRQQWEAELLRSQPDAAERGTPPAFRSPTGVVADGNAFWRAGKPYYDPARITAPTLILVGAWDGLTPLTDSQALFAQLRNAATRRLVEVPRATHFILAETGRDAAVREILSCLDAE